MMLGLARFLAGLLGPFARLGLLVLLGVPVLLALSGTMCLRYSGLALALLHSGLGSRGAGIASFLSAGSLASLDIAGNTALALAPALGGAPAAWLRPRKNKRG